MPQPADPQPAVPEPATPGPPSPPTAPAATGEQASQPAVPTSPCPPPDRGKNPLLYELAEVLRVIRERWSTAPKHDVTASRRFLYALFGTATYFAYLFLVRGISVNPNVTAVIDRATSAAQHSQGIASNLTSWPAPLLLSAILAVFFAFILSTVEKKRGWVTLYLEGVALPAVTMLIIRWSTADIG